MEDIQEDRTEVKRKILYIHVIRDPKGTTYVRFILKIESDAKMAGSDLMGTWVKIPQNMVARQMIDDT